MSQIVPVKNCIIEKNITITEATVWCGRRYSPQYLGWVPPIDFCKKFYYNIYIK
jgi:hypothetical protein